MRQPLKLGGLAMNSAYSSFDQKPSDALHARQLAQLRSIGTISPDAGQMLHHAG
ncbi:MAG: hypothetical protein IPI16_22250 [Comamonadaceae bacterium]|nr:hypothetical protein [Comamonadaceae bacterium]